MNKQESLSIAETNEIREKLGLKPIPLTQERDAKLKQSLSIEETNKLRISLGLKPIVPQGNVNPPGTDVHRTAKVNSLRQKIAKFKKINTSLRKDDLNEESNANDDNSWLDNLGAITTPGEVNPSKILLSDENKEKDGEDVDLHNVQVSYNFEQLGPENETILTLKESSIFDDAGSSDVLENEKVAQETVDKEKLRLRQMNKDRRQGRMNLHISSLDIEEEEEYSHTNIPLTIGAEQGIINTSKTKSAKLPMGKIKVKFDDTDDFSDEDVGDFKKLKIRKRKIKDQRSSKPRKVKIADRMEVVKLLDEDEDLSWMDDEQPITMINTKPTSKKPTENAEHLKKEVERVTFEEKQRAEDILRMRESTNNFVIDEKTAFLDTLDMSFPETSDTANQALLNDNGETNVGNITYQDFKVGGDCSKTSGYVNESADEEHNHDPPNFFSGLASTLGLLRKKNVLPTEYADPNVKEQHKARILKQANETKPIRKKVRNETHTDTNTYTAEELYSLNRFEGSEVSNEVSNTENKKLDHYDPEVQLVYRDEKGNQLTTKEAYKKLSQKFHGTKSNKKKKAKMHSRIEARKSAFEIDNTFGFGNS
ncbi:snu66p [Saccharomyces arboricola H-6]|uniref:Snu66p n=1 Tax=Saccharomyces arboricola (strain H-6 / AS 2.3317 / CBS 10644) TaxID=1160507 RepID=J8PW88_SACAR|nr:snu66p [Saccharomyces arboricola H-6]